MRNILILGASSPIGTALAESFAAGNSLILSGRRTDRLEIAARRCEAAGSKSVLLAAAQLPGETGMLSDLAIRSNVDLVIDAASAASISRDDEIGPEKLQGLVESDVCAHLCILERLSDQGKYPDVIFISSVLSLVSTPSREIYSMMKRLMEIYLHKSRSCHPEARILIFRVGKVIDSRADSPAALALASRVREDFSAGQHEALYGGSGRILQVLNAIHPALVRLSVRIQRSLRP